MDKRIKKGEVMPASLEVLSLAGMTEDKEPSAARIQAVYVTSDPKLPSMKATVGEDDSLRARIIRMSLFPSIYSKH